jgi:hypothetical protein
MLLSREQIVAALEALDARLGQRDRRADVLLAGGAVMCLIYRARDATKDVDAWFSDPSEVRAAAREVAEELHLPEDWLNDAVKAFIPVNAGHDAWKVLPNLTISVVDPRTLLAMKCAAARTDVDVEDIRFLANHLRLSSSRAVLDVVLTYFPEDRLPVRTRLLLEEMFGDAG